MWNWEGDDSRTSVCGIIYWEPEGGRSVGKTGGILTLILGLSRNAMVCKAIGLTDHVVTCYVIKIAEIATSD